MATFNPTRYVIAPNLQCYFVDKDTGLPLAGGQINTFTNNTRSVRKPLYTLTPSGSDFTYTALDNPLILSAVGTIVDGNGNDIVPYYDTEDEEGNPENYYIEVFSAGGVLQFTRFAWPNVGSSGSSSANAFGYNFVRNPQFYSWHNTTSFTNVGLGSLTTNDYIADDWLYQQDDASQTISFTRGSFGTSDLVEGTPAYYLSYTSSGGASQTINNLYQVYQSVTTLADQAVSVSLNVRSSVATSLTVNLVQHFGSGGSPDFTTPLITNFNLNSSFRKLESANIIIPSIAGKTIGTGGDDAVYLQIVLPLNLACTVDIVNVQLAVGSVVPAFPIRSNDDQNKATNYDNPNSIFLTGDVKMTLRNSSDPGWLMMNDGTIGNNNSGTDSLHNKGLQYKSLYSLIWNNVHSTQFAPLYTSSGVYISNYGVSADADWLAGNRLSLTKALGRVLAGAAPNSYSITIPITSVTTKNINIPFSSFEVVYNATPIKFSGTLPTTSPQINTTSTYYLGSVGSGGVYLSASNAVNGVGGGDITFTAGSTPNFFMITAGGFSSTLGQYYGEENHNQILSELVNHTHASNYPQVANAYQISNAAGFNPSAPATTNLTTATGGNTAFNVIQPTTYMNVMIKV